MKRLKAIVLVVFGCLSFGTTWAQQFSALVFTKTAGYRHESIHAGIAAIQELGKLHQFNVLWTDDAGVFNDKNLAKHQVVIFLLTTGDVLDEEQQAAFERYVRAGGGFVGVHSASDTEYKWPWYTQMVGHMFKIHPAIQSATIKVEAADFPGMDRFPPRFLFTEEWYEFDESRAEDLKYLLSVDEATYEPSEARRKNRGFHPLSWYHAYDGGRAFYTGLGHIPATYSDERFLHHLYGGIYWAATGNGFIAR